MNTIRFVFLLSQLSSPEQTQRDRAEETLSLAPFTVNQWQVGRMETREGQSRWDRIHKKWDSRLLDTLLPEGTVVWPDVDLLQLEREYREDHEGGDVFFPRRRGLWRQSINHQGDNPLNRMPWVDERRESKEVFLRCLRESGPEVTWEEMGKRIKPRPKNEDFSPVWTSSLFGTPLVLQEYPPNVYYSGQVAKTIRGHSLATDIMVRPGPRVGRGDVDALRSGEWLVPGGR